MQAVVGRQKGGHGPRRSMRRPWKTRTQYLWCFIAKSVLARIATYTFISQEKDVDRFRKGSVHELYCLKARQVSILGDPGAVSGGREKSKQARKKFGRRKVKNENKSPLGQSFNGPVPNGRCNSGF